MHYLLQFWWRLVASSNGGGGGESNNLLARLMAMQKARCPLVFSGLNDDVTWWIVCCCVLSGTDLARVKAGMGRRRRRIQERSSVWSYATLGTDAAYGPTRCLGELERRVEEVLLPAMVLRVCYRMCGSDIGYAASAMVCCRMCGPDLRSCGCFQVVEAYVQGRLESVKAAAGSVESDGLRPLRIERFDA
eukprot:1509508-Rhodomonas_salina.1